MFVQIVCQNPGGPGRNRAHRRFINGVRVRMEVLDRAEDFFTDEKKTDGDMVRINRASYARIKADHVFSCLEDGAVDDSISLGLIESLKAQLATTRGQLSDAGVENERLRGQLEGARGEAEKAKSDLETAQIRILEFEAQATASEDAAVPEAKSDSHAHGKHKK